MKRRPTSHASTIDPETGSLIVFIACGDCGRRWDVILTPTTERIERECRCGGGSFRVEPRPPAADTGGIVLGYWIDWRQDSE